MESQLWPALEDPSSPSPCTRVAGQNPARGEMAEEAAAAAMPVAARAVDASGAAHTAAGITTASQEVALYKAFLGDRGTGGGSVL